VLIVLLRAASDRSEEFDVDLQLVTRQRLLVPLEAFLTTPVPHVRGEPAYAGALQQPPDARLADRQGVIASQVHADASWAEVIVPAQIEDLLDNVCGRRTGRAQGARGTVLETAIPKLPVPSVPAIVGLAADPEIPAGLRHIVRYLVDVPEPPQTPMNRAVIPTHGHPPLDSGDSTPCVTDVLQF